MNRNQSRLGAPLAPQMSPTGVGSGSLPLILTPGREVPVSDGSFNTSYATTSGETMWIRTQEETYKFWIPPSLRGLLPIRDL